MNGRQAKKIRKKTIVLDNDYFKKQLSKKSKSPLAKFKLVHSA